MKFEYENKNDDKECVAFIRYGDLYIKERDGGNLVISDDGSFLGGLPWHNVETSPEITHKFYPGDKITITF